MVFLPWLLLERKCYQGIVTTCKSADLNANFPFSTLLFASSSFDLSWQKSSHTVASDYSESWCKNVRLIYFGSVVASGVWMCRIRDAQVTHLEPTCALSRKLAAIEVLLITSYGCMRCQNLLTYGDNSSPHVTGTPPDTLYAGSWFPKCI